MHFEIWMKVVENTLIPGIFSRSQNITDSNVRYAIDGSSVLLELSKIKY